MYFILSLRLFVGHYIIIYLQVMQRGVPGANEFDAGSH